MSGSEPVQSFHVFWQHLEKSDILRPDEFQAAREMSQETASAKMLARRLVAKGILTRWQAGRLLKGHARLRLGNHKLCEQIGRGVSGPVFLAEHIPLQRQVAVKILSRRFTQHPTIVDRFLEDARRAAQLNHPNLAHVLDIDNAAGQYYMVMEYVRGQDLQDVVQASGCLPAAEVLDYLCQAADGLHHAHQAGIVHGDLCPANLMRDQKGVIKIVGWGVARLADQPPLAEQPPGSTAANPSASDDPAAYRAPEPRQDNGVSGIAGDIHALGRTASYLLTGPPLTGQPPPTPGENASGEALTRGAESVAGDQAGASVPTALLEIIERMTAVEPEGRFDTAEAVRVALQPLREERAEPSLTEPEPRADPSELQPISDEPDEGPEGPDVSLIRTPHARHDASERPPRFPVGRRVLVGAVAAMGLVTLLVTVVAYSLGPHYSGPGGTATGSRTAARESEGRRTRPKLAPRRRRARSTALETSWPDTSATDDGSTHTPEDSVRDASRDQDLDDPPAASATSPKTSDPSGPSKAATSSAKEPPSSTPQPPTSEASGSDATDTKPPSKREASTATNPFRQLPLVVELPAFDQTGASRDALEIGELAVSAGEADVTLLGGAHASPAPGRFTLRTEEGQNSPAWTVLFVADQGRDEQEPEEPEEPEDGLEIATFGVQENQLRFSWKPAASQCAAATCLANCVLRLAVQDHVHELGLRGARTIEPLRVDLQKAALQRTCPLPAMPDRQRVRFEVTRLDDPFPRVHHVTPPHPIAAHDEEILVRLGGVEREEHMLQVTLAPRLLTTFHLECKSFFKVSPRIDWILLTPDKLELVANFVSQKQRSEHQQALRARTALSRLPRKASHRDALKKTCEALEAKLAETNQAINRLEKLRHIRQAMAEGAAVHFRLYYLADDCEVDLLRTKMDQ